MSRMGLCAAVAVCVVLGALPAVGYSPDEGWLFWGTDTSTVEREGVDGRFYQADGVSLAREGCLVQFVIGLNGAPIVDPLDYFDYNMSGQVEAATAEYADMVGWLSAGADPADISGGTNVLATASNWDGTTTLSAPGFFGVCPVHPYEILPGDTYDLIAYRAWSITPHEMATLEVPSGTEIWYLTGRELTRHNNQGGGPDTGWWIGYAGFEGGGAPTPENWTGLSSLIGWEVYNGLRDRYVLDTRLGVISPEPGPFALIGGGAVAAWLARRRRRRSQRREEGGAK